MTVFGPAPLSVLVAVALCLVVSASGSRVSGASLTDQVPRSSRIGAPVVAPGAIAGVVVTDDADNPVPIRRARVSARSVGGSRGSTVVSDDQGRFRLSGLEPGAYEVSATREGLVRGVLGATRPDGSGIPVVVESGVTSSGHVIRVLRGSVITGVVTDPTGRPLPGLPVEIARRGYREGRRIRMAAMPAVTTNDQGVYRAYGLKPGEYFVSTKRSAGPERVPVAPTSAEQVAWARRLLQSPTSSNTSRAVPPPPESPATVGFVPSYFPGVLSPVDARPIRLGRAEERGGIDFAMQWGHIVSLEGTVVLPDGSAPTGNYRVWMRYSSDSPDLADQVLSVRKNEPNGFQVLGVLPGAYTFFAEAQAPGAASGAYAYSTRVDVNVSDQAAPRIVLQLAESPTVSGRVVFEGVSDEDRPTTGVRIGLWEPLYMATYGAPSALMQPDGTFEIPGVSARRYVFSPTAPSGWTLKSIHREGQNPPVDLADVVLDMTQGGPSLTDLIVTFTQKTTELTGTLTDEFGRAASDYFVVVFGADSRYWTPRSRRISMVRPSSDGTFAISGLPEGDYRIAALTDLENGEWFDPEFLGSIVSAAVPVTLSEDTPTFQQLRILR